MQPGSQTRKYFLVIQNPEICKLTHEAIKEILKEKLIGVSYACMADEIATTGTPHTHLFLYSASPIRFRTVKNAFPVAHIEPAYGSVRENRAYVMKAGKWENTDKAATSVEGTFEEVGVMPSERAEKEPMMSAVIDGLKDGMSTWEIIDKFPKLAFRSKDIETLRQTILQEQYKREFRDVEVFYLYGDTATGKTSYVFKKNRPEDICRITSYGGLKVNFDSYSSQSILFFEEFHGQIPLPEMLTLLDRYPLMLPARYSDRVACYTKVYIASNVSPEDLYKEEQVRDLKSYGAFKRRLTHIFHFTKDGILERKENEVGWTEEIISEDGSKAT